MSTLVFTVQAIRKDVVKVISSLKKVSPKRLNAARDFTELGFDILDVVEIILKLEKKFNLTIPDEVPVYSVDDFVKYIYSHSMKQAG